MNGKQATAAGRRAFARRSAAHPGMCFEDACVWAQIEAEQAGLCPARDTVCWPRFQRGFRDAWWDANPGELEKFK